MTKRKDSRAARPLPKIDITKLDGRDKELFNKAINELLGPKGVSHDDIVAAIAKLKEDAKNKSNFSSSFGISRKIFYRRGKDGIHWKPQDWIVALVTKTFEMSRRVYGYVKIFHTLLRHCPGLNLNDVRKTYEMLRFRSVAFRIARRNPLEKKYTGHNQPDLLKGNFKFLLPSQALSTDATFNKMANGKWCYISAFIDPLTCAIVASSVGERNDANLVMDGMRQIVAAGSVQSIILSDDALTYLSEAYTSACTRLGTDRSHSPPGLSLANRPVEYLWNIWKREWPAAYPFQNADEVRRVWNQFVTWYKDERIQSQLGWKSPSEYLLSLT